MHLTNIHQIGAGNPLPKYHILDEKRRRGVQQRTKRTTQISKPPRAISRYRLAHANQTYHMLMNVCWLVVKGLLQTQEDGATRLMDFFDEQRMSHLYEKLILEYYRREHPQLNASASYISWALDDGFDDMLPATKSDITLSRGSSVLIIDAKYYAHTTQQQFDKHTVHSRNLYQIFAYVKNKEAELADVPHEVSGMLLYAATDEDVRPNRTHQMSGNQISVKKLDLGLLFEDIRMQLDAIVEAHFEREPY